MVEKGIREGICQSINKYTKADNKCIKDCHKSKELSYLKYWDLTTYMVGQITSVRQYHKSCK